MIIASLFSQRMTLISELWSRTFSREEKEGKEIRRRLKS